MDVLWVFMLFYNAMNADSLWWF